VKQTTLFFALLFSLAAIGLQAQTYWITPTNTTATAFPWNGVANWSSGIVPSATDAVVIFTNFPGSQPAVNTTNVVSGGTNTPFIFGTLVCSNSQVLNGGGQLTAAVSAGMPTIYVGSGSLWLYPLLGGTQGFNKTGAGEVTFRYNNNNNPFTGNIIISGGDLCLNIDSNLGNTNNDLVVSNNAKLLINPTTLAPVTLSPARSVTLACASANFDVAGTNWLTIPGVINESVAGQGGLQKTDSGTLALSGVNIFSGGTTVSDGVLDCQTNAALGKGSATINSGGELACDANVILTNALTLAGGTISFNGGGGAFAGPVTLTNDSTVALRSFLTGAAASGAISNAITATANTLTVAGAGTLTFASGANSSTINMLRLTNSTATLASGTLNINTGGTPGNTTVTGGSGFNNFGGSTFTVNGGTLALAGNYFIPAGNSGGGNNVFTLQSGNVNNNGSEILLAYAANGTLNINGGTFNNQSQSIRVQQGATGVVNLNGGVLALNQFDNAGGTGGTVNFNGGTLRANVNGTSLLQSHNSYVVKTGGAVIDSQGYAVSVDVPLISGSSPDGGLRKVGSGTLTLTATNSYNGPTTISAGTLALGANALITGTSSLLMNSSSTLLFALNAPSGPTNIIVNGNVTLAGQINVSDSGIVANSVYPVIYYSGNLTNNGVTVAPLSPWAFTIDTSVPHVVRLLVGTKYPLFQLTNSNFAVSTLTTNLGGILHGAPALPLWYEVRDQTNRLWDYGATPAVSPWSIMVRHLRAGTNTVTVFAKDTNGNITSNSVQLTLALGANTPVRPRPQPAEVWWGGSCHDNIYNNGSIVGTYSRMSQLLQTNGWDFCKRFQDGFFLHGYVWVNQAAQMTNWQQVGQSISAQLAPFNGKYWLEDAWHAAASNMNYGVSSASGQSGNADMLLGVGFALSEVTQDFNADWGDFCNWHPDWPTNDIRVLITGNTNQASAAYPYASGQWRDYANSYHAARPGTKFGWTWSPVWWHWQNGASLGNDSGIFTVTSNGTNYNFNWDFYNFMNDAVVAGNQSGVPFAFASDCPWEYYMQYPGNPGGWSQAQQLANRVKIRNYEAWLQNQNLRHTMICNSYTMNSSDTNASDLNYEAHSLAVMYLHQQEGGRAWRYSFESWYEGPYTVVPETKPGSYTHLALSAIKYIKGIADTNGNLEQLNITPTATNGTVAQLQLQNNGDVPCLPALAGQAGTVPGVNTRYFTTNGAEITATILSTDGLCYTNMLQPGAKTNLFAVTLASNLSAATNDNAALEAFWNPQDPLGIVRDRELFAIPLNPLGLWQDADIGIIGITGGSALSGTNFTLLGSGADVWSTADAFHFIYQTNSGDGTITARVTSQIASDPWAKAGVMIRESSAANARNVFVAISPNNGITFQNRASTGAVSYNTAAGGLQVPCWVRLTRSGTNFTAQYSAAGATWTTLGNSNLTGFASTALWGLAVSSHSTVLGSAATFDNVTLPNVAPVLNPISNRTLVAGQILTLTNTATDANLPAQTLTFSLASAPAGMTLNPTNGILSWRPTIAQSPTTNIVAVQVADNGTPSLSATQSFAVTVVSPAAPGLTVPVVSGGVFSLLVNGSSGPDYILQAATNLNPPVIWLPLLTNLTATPPLVFTNPATNLSGRFYRVLLGP
jgi:autotransporter-associated beta strand protein